MILAMTVKNGILFRLCFIPRPTVQKLHVRDETIILFAAKQPITIAGMAVEEVRMTVGVFETMQDSANIVHQVLRSSTDHVSRDLDFPWHRNAKRFTLVNPSISGYHSGSRSRD
ncbi:uncharacterized protein LOC105257028 isoform X3 [Camponotus floridanus]|uniref:uncharacterized protein LOC105257028 isoform X3 n=1 Tax=Camponotus floridanus TaxID=104421 RepID=UPI000DC688BD|nr:uncharacterized protein LOC105257028 isoform X3 [Camponotus floridanus]